MSPTRLKRKGSDFIRRGFSFKRVDASTSGLRGPFTRPHVFYYTHFQKQTNKINHSGKQRTPYAW